VRRRIALGALAATIVVAIVGWVVLRSGGRAPIDTGEMLEPTALTQPPVEPAPRPTRVVAFEEGCVRSDCHAGMAGAPAIHAPVAEGACDACHEPDAGGHVYPLARTRVEICSGCHDTGGHSLYQHRAMSEDACLACHDPHAGRTPDLLVRAEVAPTCAGCHPPSDGRAEHPPYAGGRCDSCHDPHGAENAHLLLGGSGADHCRLCHAGEVQNVEAGAGLHAKLEGSCLACHSAHAADQAGLLATEPRDLCTSCHPEVGTTVAEAAVSHDPVLEGHQCVSCHDPHSSRNPRMLRETQPAVCMSCHEEPVVGPEGREIPALAPTLASAPVVHGAVREGDCSACHSVHGGSHARLLRAIKPDVLPGPYDVRNYALCFACHDPDLAESGATTLFRDGDRNLHEVHLRSESGASGCGACHSVHSGDLPRLVASTVDYEGSGWAMPMGFELTPDGGSCAPPCHEPLAYSRREGGARDQRNGGSP
jgi:predicted CXXCH cytochrome family protein